jgi:hypothetical protein
MFAPRPFDVAKEMVRVTKPGGRFVMGNWIPNDPDARCANPEDQLRLFAASTGRVCQSDDVGRREPRRGAVRQGGYSAREDSFVRDTYTFESPGTPSSFVADFRQYYGPTMNAFDAAGKNGRQEDLQKELETLFEAQNIAPGGDTTKIPATFCV